MRRPVAVLVPTLGLLLVLGSPFLHVRFNAPDSTILPASVPSRAAFDRLAATFGEGEFAPLDAGGPDHRPATSTGEPRGALRLLAAARGRPADQRVDGLVDVDPRLGLEPVRAPLRRAQRAARPVHREALAATTKGDLTAFTVFTPYGPNRAEGRALVRRPARPGRRRCAAAGHDASSSAVARPT